MALSFSQIVGPAHMSIRSRATVGLLMGAIAFALTWVLLSARWGLLTGGIAAAIIVFVTTALAISQSGTVRRAWAWMCLIDGILSAGLAVSSIAARGAPYMPGTGYEEEMRRAIGPMPPMGTIFAIALAAAAVLAAVLLIILGLWMLHRDRHRQQRSAS